MAQPQPGQRVALRHVVLTRIPKNVKFWSVRWVLLHAIEETARHGGHADIIREALDGKTWYELMANAEGWTDVYAWASREIPLQG